MFSTQFLVSSQVLFNVDFDKGVCNDKDVNETFYEPNNGALVKVKMKQIVVMRHKKRETESELNGANENLELNGSRWVSN